MCHTDALVIHFYDRIVARGNNPTAMVKYMCVCVCVLLRMHVTWAQYSSRHTNETKSWTEALAIPPSMCRART